MEPSENLVIVVITLKKIDVLLYSDSKAKKYTVHFRKISVQNSQHNRFWNLLKFYLYLENVLVGNPLTLTQCQINKVLQFCSSKGTSPFDV